MVILQHVLDKVPWSFYSHVQVIDHLDTFTLRQTVKSLKKTYPFQTSALGYNFRAKGRTSASGVASMLSDEAEAKQISAQLSKKTGWGIISVF